MKDGRFENADELRVWLDRKPIDLIHFVWASFRAACGTDKPNQRTTSILNSVTCLECLAEVTTPGAPPPNSSCPKCHGAGHYVVECSTPGWRMVDCECSK